MIDRIEISKSGRAKCVFCGEKIPINTPRGVIKISRGYCNSESFYCYKCVPKKLSLEKANIKFIEQNFELDKIKCKKEIIANEL